MHIYIHTNMHIIYSYKYPETFPWPEDTLAAKKIIPP